MTDAREEILERVREATRGAATEPRPSGYVRAGALDPAARVARFCERVGEYRAEVLRVTDVAETVAAVAQARGASRLVVPKDLPRSWRPAQLEVVEDDGFSAQELDGLHGVVTGC